MQIKLTGALLLMASATAMADTRPAHDWENHHILQINREPARAAFIPYGDTRRQSHDA